MFWLHFCRVQIAEVPLTPTDLVEIDVNSTFTGVDLLTADPSVVPVEIAVTVHSSSENKGIITVKLHRQQELKLRAIIHIHKKDMMASLSLVAKQSTIETYPNDDEVIKNAEVIGNSGIVERTGKEDSFTFAVESINGKKISQIKLDAVRISEDTEDANEQFGVSQRLRAYMRVG
ncbi:hypothetical protein MKX01_022073 [Papaver californicum]|nr:hypothetical protein MKX01_022073 [Papaver californicum]